MANEQYNGMDFHANMQELEKLYVGMESFLDLKNKLSDATKLICSLQNSIATTNDWVGNGKNECATVLMLLAEYSSLLCGEPSTAVDIQTDNRALNCKELVGNGEHLQNVIDVIHDFHDEVGTYSTLSTHKPNCISQLDSIV